MMANYVTAVLDFAVPKSVPGVIFEKWPLVISLHFTSFFTKGNVSLDVLGKDYCAQLRVILMSL